MTTTRAPMTADERKAIEDRWVKKTADTNYEQGCTDVEHCLSEIDRLAAEAGEQAP